MGTIARSAARPPGGEVGLKAAPDGSDAGCWSTARAPTRCGCDRCGSASDRYPQLLEAAEHEVVPVGDRIGDDLHVAEPLHQGVDDDLALEPGQRGTEAVVDPVRDAQVRTLVTTDVEAV